MVTNFRYEAEAIRSNSCDWFGCLCSSFVCEPRDKGIVQKVLFNLFASEGLGHVRILIDRICVYVDSYAQLQLL